MGCGGVAGAGALARRGQGAGTLIQPDFEDVEEVARSSAQQLKSAHSGRPYFVIPAQAGIQVFALTHPWRGRGRRVPDTLCLRQRWRATSWAVTGSGCRAVVVPSGGGHIRVWVESSEGQGGTRERRRNRGHGACPRGVRRPKVPPLRCRSRRKDMDSRLRGNDEIRPAAMRRER